MIPKPSRPIEPLAGGAEIGPYRLVRPLGAGGMAQVFLAVHRHLGHLRALKLLPPERCDVRAALAMRLLTEARAMARLQHPAIVEVFDCDVQPDGGAFIAMEYLQGEPVGAWLQRVGSLERQPRLAAALIGAVADALAYAHRQGVIHRDLKPDNLFVVPGPSGSGRFSVKVLDFGIAKILREKPLVKTQVGFVLGTPFYLAPEAWESGGCVDERTDIYSLGCVFFELLSGRRPFESEDALQLMRAHLLEDAPNVAQVAPHAPDELAALIARMLHKSPLRRPASMSAVVAELERYLAVGRDRFADLLLLPADPCLVANHPPRAERTSLGLGVVELPEVTSTTEVSPAPSAKRGPRWRRVVVAAAAIGALWLLLALPRATPIVAQAPSARDQGSDRAVPVSDSGPSLCTAPLAPIQSSRAVAFETPVAEDEAKPPPIRPAKVRKASAPWRPLNAYRPVSD